MLPISFILLLLALAGLIAAPFIDALMQRSPSLRGALDALVLVMVGGLLAFHLVPHAIEEAGLLAIAGLLVGLGLPVFLEYRGGEAARRAHGAALLLALGGLSVHAAIDGVALAVAGGVAPVALGTAVVLHRVPMGLLLWSRARHTFGVRAAVVLIAVLVVATLIGFALGPPVQEALQGAGVGVFQALVAGSLAHVLVHRPERPQGRGPRPALRTAQLGGAVAGVLGLGFIELDIGPSYGANLLALARHSAPALLVGYALAGALAEALPAGTVAWLKRGGLRGAARATAVGLPMPVCSCGTVGLHGDLLGRGVPVAAATAFALATPLLAVEAVLLSVPLLGGELALARVGASVLIALVAGWAIGRFGQRATTSGGGAEDAPLAEVTLPRGAWARTRSALRVGFVESSTRPRPGSSSASPSPPRSSRVSSAAS